MKDSLEEAAERLFGNDEDGMYLEKRAFIKGAKLEQEISYNEEEVIDLLKALQIHYLTYNERINIDKWFEQFKK